MAAEPKQLTGEGGLEITLVTPRGEVTHRSVASVTAQGALGEFEILPGHMPFLTMLRTGVMILAEGNNRSVYAHGPGFLEVTAAGRVRALVEQARPARDVEAGAVEADLTKVEQELKELAATGDATWQNLQARRDWDIAQLDARARAGA
jgi:F-type H+-transporting ATPase subunit epsilon